MSTHVMTLFIWFQAAKQRFVEMDVRDERGAILEETALRVLVVGAAIAAGIAIAVLIENNVSNIPTPGG